MIWDLIGYIAIAYWSIALLNTVLNLLLIRRLRDAPPAREPFVSVVVPARNEERAIERTVRALLAQNYAHFEVVVVDDRSTDATAAILASIRDERLIVVPGEEPPSGWIGKPWALHQGAQRARGELLLFVDADIHYEPGALRAAVGEIERSGAAMLCLFARMEMRGLWENAIVSNIAMTGFSAVPIWLGDRIGTAMFAIGGGTGNLIRRAEYDAIGGHEALRAAVIDDIGLARHVRSEGHHTELVRADEFASVRMYHGLREAVHGFTKNTFIVMHRSWLFLAAGVTGLFLFSILPYAFAIADDRASLVAVGILTLTRVVLFASFGYPLWSAVFLHPLQSLAWMFIMIRSAWMTGVRGEVAWRGRTYDAAHTRFGA